MHKTGTIERLFEVHKLHLEEDVNQLGRIFFPPSSENFQVLPSTYELNYYLVDNVTTVSNYLIIIIVYHSAKTSMILYSVLTSSYAY